MSESLAAPAQIVTQAEMNEWYTLTQQLPGIKAREMELRKKIFGANFVNPVEGTNTKPLADGWVLKGQYKIDRKVDEAALETLSSVFKEHKIPVKDLVKWSPELVTSAYRELDEDQEKIFNQALLIKPGSPSLEIVKPKKASK